MAPDASEQRSARVHRLGNLPGVHVQAVSEDGQTALPWLDIEMARVVEDLTIDETDLAREVAAIPVQLMHWGRLEARARRVWELAERNLRQWREGVALQLLCSDGSAGWKKATVAEIEARYRSAPAYRTLSAEVERAHEALNAVALAREAFAAKRDMLRVAVRSAPERSGMRLSV